MKAPRIIPIENMPPDIFKLVNAKWKMMRKKGVFKFGFGQATVCVIRDLINGKK